jgi:hypothetical protein
MTKPTLDNQIKNFIIDSLMSKCGQILTTDVIQEISAELITRMTELMEGAKEAAINEIVY